MNRSSRSQQFATNEVVTTNIANVILLIRGQKMILDADLAALYGVPTKRMNEQVKRNVDRFPPDFMFKLSSKETKSLNRSQNATGSQKHRDPRFPPYAFSEHGAIMAAMILNSARAVEMSVYVVRTFVRLREVVNANVALTERLNELEGRLNCVDADIVSILAAIRELMVPPDAKRSGIGFLADLG
jgi:ORF6N domain